jgi:chitodextrinase
MSAQPSRAPLAPRLQARATRLTDEVRALAEALRTSHANRASLSRRLAVVSRLRDRTLERLLARDPAAARPLLLPARLRHNLARVPGARLERPVVLTGWYRVWHHDDFRHPSRDTYLDQLVTRDGKVVTLRAANSGVSVPLTLARLRPTRLTVRGYALGGQLLATRVHTLRGARQLAAASTTAAATTGAINTAILVANFADSTTSIDINGLKAMFQGNPGGDVVSYFKEASYGKAWIVPSFYGPYRLAENSQSGCGSLNPGELMQLANADIDFTKVKRLIIVANCAGYGATASNELPSTTPDGTVDLATIVEDREYAQQLYVNIHELSHTLGGFNAHASDYVCLPDAFEPPTRFEKGCDAPEYTDPFDVLGGSGSSIGQLDPYHKANAGWLSSSQFPAVTASGSYTLAPYESPGSGIVALNIPRGSSGSSFTVEYRQPIGFDGWMTSCDRCTVTQGASIRLSDYGVDGSGGGSDTELIDTTPGTIDDGGYTSNSDANDGALLPGKSFTDPEYGITISAVSASSSGLSVNVTLSSQATCAHAAPRLSAPSLTSGAGGPSPTYTLTVTNADSSTCATNTFRFLPRSSAGTQYIATPDLFKLAPGASATISLVASLPKTTVAGTYTLSPGQFASNSLGDCSMCYYQTTLAPLSYQYSPAADTTPPTAPTLPVANALGSGVVSLTWGPSTDAVGVAGYKVLRNGAAFATTSATTLADAGLAASATYSYSIQAFDATGNYSAPATVTVTTPSRKESTAPTPPLVSAAATDRTVTLSWSPSLDLDGTVAAYRLSPCLLTQCTFPATARSVQIDGLPTQTRYDLTISAIDADGNTANSRVTTVYTAPVGDSAPAQPQRLYMPSGTFAGAKLAWTASSGAAQYQIYRNNRPLATVTGTSFTDPVPGAHEYYVQAVSAGGALSQPTLRMSAMGPSTASPDATPPTASLSAPAGGSIVSGVVTVTAQASDNVGVYEVDYYVDGQVVGMSRSSPFTYRWDTTRFSDGPHWLNVVAYDTSHNYASDGGYTVSTVNGGGGSGDTAPPAVSILAPLTGASVSGSVPVSAGASDNVGVTKVEFSVDGALLATAPTGPYGFTWDASKAAPGSHTITATAYDAAGNKAAASVSVNVPNSSDTTPPTVSISSPANGATVSGTVQVQASASDNVGVTKITLAVDGSLTSTLTSGPWTFSVDTTGLAAGDHTLTATAYDAAGNSTGALSSVTVQNGIVDATPPSKPSGLRAAATGTTQVALFWTPTADNVGVVAYDVYRDGTLVAKTALPNYLDSGLTPGTSHAYSVQARDAAGNTSVPSSNLSAKTVALSTSSTGTLAGVVYNANGRPVANAIVQLSGNGITKSAKTNTSGVYKFTSLPPAQYTLTLTMPTTAGATTNAATPGTDVTVVSGQTIVLATP